MAIIARDTGTNDFEPAPEGLFAAIAVDVVDRGMVESQWGTAHKIQIRWQLDGHGDAGLRADGKQWLVTRQFTLSLHEKAALRGFLVSWRGKQFTAEELRGFDLENIVGAPCMVQVLHNKSADGLKTFANVQNIMPLPKGIQKPVASEYVRMVDRPTDAGAATANNQHGHYADYEPEEEEVMPF